MNCRLALLCAFASWRETASLGPFDSHKGAKPTKERKAVPIASMCKPLFVILIILAVVSFGRAQEIPREARYPAHWWTPINDPHKPDWEILPQEAKPGEVILSKRNELGLLSNFAATPFTFRGKRYASLE